MKILIDINTLESEFKVTYFLTKNIATANYNDIPFCLKESNDIPTIIERIIYENIKKYNIEITDSGIVSLKDSDYVKISFIIISAIDNFCKVSKYINEIYKDIKDATKIFVQSKN